MEDYRYCKTTTVEHRILSNNIIKKQISDVLCPINNIIQKEGGGSVCYENLVINIDEYERVMSRHYKTSPRSTMDIAVGCKRENCKRNVIIIAEFKFNVKNPGAGNWGDDIGKKITHSENILKHTELDCPEIHNNYYFVFKDDKINHAISFLNRSAKKNKSYKIISKGELCRLFDSNE